MEVTMRKLGCFFLLTVFGFSSCLSTGNVKSGNVKKLEERITIDAVVFTNDELEIYDLLIDVLISRNSKRVPQEVGMEIINKYSIEEAVKNPQLMHQLLEEAAIEIDNPQIVIYDKTTIPSLRSDKTFDENMESSLKYVNENLGEEYSALFLDFKKNNENDYSLAEYITKNNKLISHDSVRLAMGDLSGPIEYWTKFYELNPNACGSVTFSRIGFKDNNAFIEVKFMKGGMDGFIDYLILENSGDSWKVVKSIRHVYY
jgi:hypothetical protein